MKITKTLMLSLVTILFLACQQESLDLMEEQNLQTRAENYRVTLELSGIGEIIESSIGYSNPLGTINVGEGFLFNALARYENFLYWTVNGSYYSDNVELNILIDKNTYITAVTENGIILKIEGSGTVTTSQGGVYTGAGIHRIPYNGYPLELTASAGRFAGWFVGNGSWTTEKKVKEGPGATYEFTACFNDIPIAFFTHNYSPNATYITEIKGYAFRYVDDALPSYMTFDNGTYEWAYAYEALEVRITARESKNRSRNLRVTIGGQSQETFIPANSREAVPLFFSFIAGEITGSAALQIEEY